MRSFKLEWLKSWNSIPSFAQNVQHTLHTYVYRCIMLRANSIASITFLLDGEPLDLPASALVKCECSLCTHGALYIEKATQHVLNPAAMSIEADPSRGITGFVWRSGAITRRYAKDDIAYVSLWSPYSDIGPGISPLKIAQDAAATALAAEHFTRAFFEQGALPPIIITPSEGSTVTDADTETIRTVWQRMVAGARNAWRALILKKSVDVKPLDIPALDKLAMQDVDDISLRRIATAFGVPVTMLTDASNYATAREHRISYWRDTVIPEAELIASAWSDVFNGEVTIRYDDIEALAEDEAEKRKSVAELYQAGILTLPEARAMLGLDEPHAAVDTSTFAASLEELHKWRAKSQAREVRCAEWKPESLSHDWYTVVKTLDRLGVRDPFAWARHIDLKAAGRITPRLEREERNIADALAVVLDKHKTEDGQFDRQAFERELRDTVTQALFDIALDSAVAAMISSAGFADAEAAFDFAARWAAEYSFELVKGITEHTATSLARLLDDARRYQWSRDVLVARIARLFGTSRAEAIATTELTRAFSQGTEIARQVLESAGVERVHVWRTAADELVCDICGPRNGKPRHTNWSELPPAHVNCRCWTTLERVKKR